MPYGIGFEEIEQLRNILMMNLGAVEIEFERDERLSMIDITVITKPLFDLKYEPLRTEPHEIYVGYNYKRRVLIDLNTHPHVLIGGETGSGKSRLLLLILTNLINQHKDIDLYMIQIRKSDVSVFKDCTQVKYFARNLEETRDLLKHLNSICIEREKIIDKVMPDGVYNISDYNKKFSKKLNYIYVILDEFSFFNPNGADDKASKTLKKEILGNIKNIVMVGRSLGIFVFTSLQKPNQTSIPSDIKSQLTTRISFKQLDSASSILILGNGNATALKRREALVRTISEETLKIPFIDHNLIMFNIKDSVELDHKYVNLNKEKIGPIVKENNMVQREVFKGVNWA